MQVKLADPDIVSDPTEYQKLAQSVAELNEVLLVYLILFYLPIHLLLVTHSK